MGMQKAIAAFVGGLLAIISHFIDIPKDIVVAVNTAIPMLTVAAVFFIPNKSRDDA